MEIKIIRENSNCLYTEGRMFVNGSYFADTVECTSCMLKAGEFKGKLADTRMHKKRQLQHTEVLGIKERQWVVNGGTSWIISRKFRTICIGKFMFPGALFHNREAYESLMWRVRACVSIGEPICISIEDEDCKFSRVHAHWGDHDQQNMDWLTKGHWHLWLNTYGE